MDVVVTGLFTLLGAFGGVWLTQRYASGEAHEARVEARRDAQRRVVAELLIAGRSKVERYMVLLPFAKKFTDQDWIDYLETDSGRELGRVNAELQRSLAQARLLIGDASMSSNVERLLLLNNEFSDAVMGSALKGDIGTGFAHLGKLSGVLNAIEASAAVSLQTTVEHKPQRVALPWTRRST